MNSTEIKAIIKQQLPEIIAQDALIRDFVLRTVSEYYASKQETESKFDRILAELERDRQEQRSKWEENNRRWEENNRRWEEQNQFNKQILEQIQKLDRKHDSTIGALGSRWGLYSEGSFRNALKGILKDFAGIEVLNLNDFDDQGEVFGRPDQIEIDVIIKNGLVIVCEIKSSMSKADMYIFNRKVEFYQKRHQRQVNRKLVISPMVDNRALTVAENLGIEVYSYAEDVPNL